MQAAELIRIVEQAGGHLEPDGDSLVVEAPEPLGGQSTPPQDMALLERHSARRLNVPVHGD